MNIPSRFPDPGEGDEMDRAWDRYKDGLSELHQQHALRDLPVWHVSRSWGPEDPFVGSCGCEVAPCGSAVADSNPKCIQHGLAAAKSIRNSHSAERCTA